MAGSVDLGLAAASHPDVRLVVCDAASGGRVVSDLRHAEIPCPLLLRHDLSRQAIDALYDVALLDADIRPSFRDYDDLATHLTPGSTEIDGNATRAILRALMSVTDPRTRDFLAVMSVLGERPVMQDRVSRSLMMSSSSFRAWLASLRRENKAMPAFPGLNAHFVTLHLLWRRSRLGWSAKRAAVAAGFGDDKACANYVRYHLGATATQLERAGGFDARVTATQQLFRASSRHRNDVIARI